MDRAKEPLGKGQNVFVKENIFHGFRHRLRPDGLHSASALMAVLVLRTRSDFSPFNGLGLITEPDVLTSGGAARNIMLNFSIKLREVSLNASAASAIIGRALSDAYDLSVRTWL
jgi:hypothetical protein